MSRAVLPPLIGGPYRAPRCRAGRPLTCSRRGEQTVAGLTDAPIPWPFASQSQGGGKRLLILCGDLERAVATESAAAVAAWWGVSRYTVRRWRRVLGVDWWTPGTRWAWSELARGKFGHDERS